MKAVYTIISLEKHLFSYKKQPFFKKYDILDMYPDAKRITKMQAAESYVFLPFTYKHVVYLDISFCGLQKRKNDENITINGDP